MSNTVYDDQEQKHDKPLIDDDERAKLRRVAQQDQDDAAFGDIMRGNGMADPVERTAAKKARKEQKAADKAKTDRDAQVASGGAVGAAAGGLAGRLAGFGKKTGKFFFGSNRRKAATGGGIVGTTGVGLLIGFFSAASGPFQMIHAGQIFQNISFSRNESFINGRTAKFALYALAGKPAKGRLGIIQQAKANRIEAKLNDKGGLKSVYDKNTGRLIGYQVLDAEKAKPFLDDMEKEGITRSTDAPGGGDIDGKDLDGPKDFIGTRDSSFRERRSVTRTAVRAVSHYKVLSPLSSRLLIKGGGIDFHPLKNYLRKKADDGLYNRAVQKAAADQQETGTANTTGELPDPDAPDDKPKTKFVEAREKVNSMTKVLKGPALAVASVCIVKGFGDTVDAQNLANVKQMERMGMSVITGGSQAQSNIDTNLNEIGAHVALYTDHKTGTSLTDYPGVQQELGEQPRGQDTVSEDTKPGAKEKPWFFSFAQSIPVVGPVCDLVSGITNTVGQWGPIEAASKLMEAAINIALLPTGHTIDELRQGIVDLFANKAVNLAAEGSERGGLALMGTQLAANEQIRALGGSKLTDAQFAEIDSKAREDQKAYFAQASIYDKYFNIYESQSLAANIAADVPQTPQQFANMFLSIPNKIGSMLAGVTGTAKVSAQSEGARWQYPFPFYGFTAAEQNDPKYADWRENEDYMLADPGRLDRMNKEYGKECFNMEIPASGPIVYGESGDPSLIPDKCNDRSNEELTRYRFYIADNITALTQDCYEGGADSCSQIGAGGAAAPTPAPAAPVNNGTITIGDTSAQTCAAGTDAGVGDGYADGKLYKIRLCTVQGIQVNSQIAVNVDKLLNDAKAQGVEMSGGGFRTMADQQATYNANCGGGSCSPPTAKPGYSNHQMGLAIDFTQGGNTISSSSSGFTWLKSNASTYGLKNLPSEAWHWSYNGN